MKVAIALFVKNEQQDIASWIAWHLALGVDKLFILDDHSTDDTYEIIKTAAEMYDIDLYQTEPEKITFFYNRQKMHILDLIKWLQIKAMSGLLA